MEIFKKVGESARSIGEGAKSLGKKSSDLVGVAKLKYEISKLEKEMEINFSAMGRLVYMQYNSEQGLEAEMDQLINSTRALEEEIDALEAQIDQLNPKQLVCPNCNTELPAAAKYCFKCGSKME
ncbi:MAG: hypothetical protein A4E53_02766 [Pelotomaculum sp. PtaB.Bin104]|nr:MAG: hypothetical protein A4E53_02766 [Pelotomaculum sp. PtaB.Bin104]